MDQEQCCFPNRPRFTFDISADERQGFPETVYVSANELYGVNFDEEKFIENSSIYVCEEINGVEKTVSRVRWNPLYPSFALIEFQQTTSKLINVGEGKKVIKPERFYSGYYFCHACLSERTVQIFDHIDVKKPFAVPRELLKGIRAMNLYKCVNVFHDGYPDVPPAIIPLGDFVSRFGIRKLTEEGFSIAVKIPFALSADEVSEFEECFSYNMIPIEGKIGDVFAWIMSA